MASDLSMDVGVELGGRREWRVVGKLEGGFDLGLDLGLDVRERARLVAELGTERREGVASDPWLGLGARAIPGVEVFARTDVLAQAIDPTLEEPRTVPPADRGGEALRAREDPTDIAVVDALGRDPVGGGL